MSSNGDLIKASCKLKSPWVPGKVKSGAFCPTKLNSTPPEPVWVIRNVFAMSAGYPCQGQSRLRCRNGTEECDIATQCRNGTEEQFASSFRGSFATTL